MEKNRNFKMTLGMCCLPFLSPNCNAEQLPSHDEVILAIKNINEKPDILHNDFTPSVSILISYGERALIPELIELLINANENSRLHAQRVLEEITMRQNGFRPGQDWAEESRAIWLKLWRSLGDYQFDSDIKERREAYRLWMQYIKKSNVDPARK